MAVIGIDLGGTKISGALFTPEGLILKKDLKLIGDHSGADVGSLIRSMVDNLLRYAGQKNMKVDAIGCCVPGAVNQKEGTVWAPNIPGWEEYPLEEELSVSFARENIRVLIDSDRACSILGEVWQGAAQGCKDAIFLAVGTGIGAGIMANGRILRGSHDIAGAIGWMALQRPYLEKFISCGCFEHYASGDGLARVALEYLSEDKSYSGILKGISPEELSARDVFDACQSGDSLASKVIGTAVEFWGMATANLVSLFNPEIVIFGGGVFGPATSLIADIAAEAKKWAQPVSIRQVRFEPSRLGGDAALTGAACLALKMN